MTNTLKVQTGLGEAFPLNPPDMCPAALDGALGATAAYETWQAANIAGAAAGVILRAAQADWRATHPQTDYADRVSWEHAHNLACRELQATVDAATLTAREALLAYDRKQRNGLAAGRPSLAAAYLEADARAIEALKTLDEAIETREALTKYLVVPTHSASPGSGHFMWAKSSLGADRMSLNGELQRRDIAVIVRVAPRDLVKALVAAKPASTK